MTVPQQIGRMDAGRLRGYADLLSFYQDNQWPGGVRRRERRLTFNYVKTFVDGCETARQTDAGRWRLGVDDPRRGVFALAGGAGDGGRLSFAPASSPSALCGKITP